MPSLHVLIATIGRPSLQIMLDSILPFLTEVDHLTIVFDGVEPTQINTETKGMVHVHHEPVSLGYWGHGVRNKYAHILEKTDFVMHADDDDEYKPGAFDAVRKLCIDTNTLYVAKIHRVIKNVYIPAYPKIENTNIGTPCGIIPYEVNLRGDWGGKYGGDYMFYHSIEDLVPVVFLDHVIYSYNCRWD